MAQDKCTWCNNYGATTFKRTIPGKGKFVSKQKFCSLRCESEYDRNIGTEWKEDKPSSTFIIFIIIIFIWWLLSHN